MSKPEFLRKSVPLKDRIGREKPWAKLGMTRSEWKKSKLWKGKFSEEEFTRLVLRLDQEVIDEAIREGEADMLVEGIFGSEVGKLND